MSTETIYRCDSCGAKSREKLATATISQHYEDGGNNLFQGDWCPACQQSVIDALENRKRLQSSVNLEKPVTK